MTERRRIAASFLLAATLGLAALGQFYFFHRQGYLWDGVVLHFLALACFLSAWRLVAPPSEKKGPSARPRLDMRRWLRNRPAVGGFLALGLLFSGMATALSRHRAWNESTVDLVGFWLLGMVAVGIGAFWPAAPPERPAVARPGLSWAGRWRSRLQSLGREQWLEVATITGLAAIAFVLRAVALDSVPYTLAGDEAWFGLTARQVLSGELRNPFVTAYVSMPTLFYWPITWSLRLVGDGVAGLRLPSALVGTATVLMLYVLARRLWGRRTALLSATFLATYHYHIHYSRIGTNNIWDALFAVTLFWFLDRAVGAMSDPDATRCQTATTDRVASSERGETVASTAGTGPERARFFILTGWVLGLSNYFYTGARLLPVLALAYVAFVAIGRRKNLTGATAARHWPGPLAAMLAAYLVTAGPMLMFAATHPDDWNARINQVGIIQSGWLAREPGLTGKGSVQILAGQFLRAAGAFHAFSDRTAFYGIDRPLLGFVPGILALLGMAWAAAHRRERRHFLVLAWFWAVILTGGMLTESPPSSQRLVMAIPAVALLVAMGTEQTVGLAARVLQPHVRSYENVALGLLVAAMGAGSIRFYFVDYSPSRVYGSAHAETGAMIGHYLQTLEGEYTAYFFGAPRIYWGFGTMAFLAPETPGVDVLEPLRAPPDFVDESRGALFIFLPERSGELAWVQEALPGGHLREFHDPGGRLRFLLYEAETAQP
jgi:4-amino-4-deoxy-L-arabinose transferase-like glycosyltransferase